MVRRIFFLFGIIAALIYIAAVVIGGIMRPDYNHLSMAVSELIASGAANKQLLDALFIAYNALLLVFAWSVGMSVRGDGKGIAVSGAAILAVVALLGLAMTLFFPMDPRGAPATTAGTIHLVLAGALSLGSILSILFLALGMKDRDAFWVYSMLSGVLVLVSGGFAAVTAIQGSSLMGLAERITIGLFLQWIVVLSGRLVKEDLGR
jgi:hypothetical protein